jgi:hypothetical protein
MVSSSAPPVIGVLLIPFARTFVEILGLLGVIFVGLLMYVKMNVFNILLVVKLLDSMTKQPLVSNKIKLAKRFVVASFVHLMFATGGSVLLLIYEVSSVVPTVFFEVNIAVGTWVQMRCFMFRQQYAGESPGRGIEVGEAAEKCVPVVLVEPEATSIALVTAGD